MFREIQNCQYSMCSYRDNGKVGNRIGCSRDWDGYEGAGGRSRCDA